MARRLRRLRRRSIYRALVREGRIERGRLVAPMRPTNPAPPVGTVPPLYPPFYPQGA